ncbi:MAG: SDR family oxidoreductase [bacterium]|nr:SDR family oxidoreductase [bacterium]
MEQPIAVITGGTGALGQAVVPLLVRRNFKIAVTYIVPEEARALEKAIDLDEDQLLLRRVDSTDPESINIFMKDTVEAFGGINVLCALVGGWAGGRYVAETDDLRFDRMVDLNLRSAFYSLRAAIPHMRDADWGRIIAVGSKAASDAPAGQAAYNMVKAGVESLIKTVARELDDTNVTANVILPTAIDTQATRAALPYADYIKWPKPEEIASVIDFLASPNSGVITGAAIPVSGVT